MFLNIENVKTFIFEENVVFTRMFHWLFTCCELLLKDNVLSALAWPTRCFSLPYLGLQSSCRDWCGQAATEWEGFPSLLFTGAWGQVLFAGNLFESGCSSGPLEGMVQPPGSRGRFKVREVVKGKKEPSSLELLQGKTLVFWICE